MIPQKYAYFFFQLLFFIPLVVIWRKKPRLHFQIILIGSLSAIASIICAYFFWTIDWWHPQTITGTRIGLEDALLGFTNGGIAVSIFDWVSNKKTKYRQSEIKSALVSSIFVFGCFLILLSLIFWGIGLSSFWATTVTMLIFIALIDFTDNQYLNNSIFSALAMLITVFPVYLSILIFSPTTIPNTYFFEKLSGITFLGIPIEEFVFYGLFGAMMGPIWDWLIDQSSKKSISKRKKQ